MLKVYKKNKYKKKNTKIECKIYLYCPCIDSGFKKP